MKRKLISLALVINIILSFMNISIITVSAATNISIGDYIQMGTYCGEPILWRCVDIDENGPLILSDKALCAKEFDHNGNNIGGSHGRGYNNGYNRKKFGSNYWGDSNIRCWLNSKEQEENVTWSCGNEPSYKNEQGFLNSFTDEEFCMIKCVSQKNIIDGNEYYDMAQYGQETHKLNEDIETVVQNYDNSYFQTFNDYIFLLDVKQLYNVYCNLGNYYKASFSTNVSNTESNECIYWLRTPFCDYYKYASSDNIVRCVYPDGTIRFHHAYYDDMSDFKIGVRPAFYLNVEYADFLFGDGSKSNPFSVHEKDQAQPKSFFCYY